MNRELRTAFFFVLPLVAFAVLLLLVPVAGTFYASLWQDVSFLARKFVGLANYGRMFADHQFIQSAVFTISFALASVVLELVFGMAIALVVNEKIKARGVLRGIALLPWAIPSVVGARIWQLVYRYDFGLANQVLNRLLGTSVNWLGSPASAFFCLVTADVWRTTPFVAIILLAGLQAVPEEVYRQARVDGAGIFERFRHVTLPLLGPVLVVALLFRTVDALRVFDIIYVMTGGGPAGATSSLSLYSYKYYALGDFGYGSAVSVALFVVAFAAAIGYTRLARFRQEVL